mgnify:CR=1 FL=1
MNSTETYHDFLRRMRAKVQSVTLHYEDDSVTVSAATLQTCYHDGCTWRRANTLLEDIAADDAKRFYLLARKADFSKTRTNRRKTYLGGLDVPFASLVQG